MNIYWRKMNTNKTTYISVQPSTAWKIVRAGNGWNVMHAIRDGDEYTVVNFSNTLKQGKKFAEDWFPA